MHAARVNSCMQWLDWRSEGVCGTMGRLGNMIDRCVLRDKDAWLKCVSMQWCVLWRVDTRPRRVHRLRYQEGVSISDGDHHLEVDVLVVIGNYDRSVCSIIIPGTPLSSSANPT